MRPTMSLAANRMAVEKAAEAVVESASTVSFLVCGDPLGLVTPHIGRLEHSFVCQVATLLLTRFRSTVVGQLPPFEPLAAAAEQLLLPMLRRLEACCNKHRAFQSAFSLAPLLGRVVTVAAQCCSFAMLDVVDAGVSLPLLNSMRGLAEVISDAVLDRAERYRPLDAPRIAAAHQTFEAQQAELSSALLEAFGGPDAKRQPVRALAALPERPVHTWRNEEFRQFWEAKCAPKYDGAVPIDVLATYLLRHTGFDATMQQREAVMRRLGKLDRKEKLLVAEAELDRLGAEVRRVGGLRAWVTAVPADGGAESATARVGPVAVRQPTMASTWSSLDTSAYRFTASSGWQGTSAPTSARTTAERWRGASAPDSARTTAERFFPPRDKEGRMPPCDEAGRVPTANTAPTPGSVASPRWSRRPVSMPRTMEKFNPLLDSVEKSVLKDSQRLVFGNKVAVDVRSSSFGETPLHAAALRDKRQAPFATMLLSRGANVNAEDRHAATPLHFAASAGNKEVAKKLVVGGADVCKEDRWSLTPLHKAALNGQEALVELLLDSGASATAADEWGATPLHRAVARSQLAVAERLLKARAGGADPNIADRAGEYPLHMAASRGDYAMVKLLLEHGACSTIRSRIAGRLPEEYAQEHGHRDVVALLAHRTEWVSLRSTAIVA